MDFEERKKEVLAGLEKRAIKTKQDYKKCLAELKDLGSKYELYKNEEKYLWKKLDELKTTEAKLSKLQKEMEKIKDRYEDLTRQVDDYEKINK